MNYVVEHLANLECSCYPEGCALDGTLRLTTSQRFIQPASFPTASRETLPENRVFYYLISTMVEETRCDL